MTTKREVIQMLRLSKYAALIGSVALLGAPALAIPGPTVSYGANPVWSVGGDMGNAYDGGTASPSISVAGQDTVITDLTITHGRHDYVEYGCLYFLELTTSTETVAKYSIQLVVGNWSPIQPFNFTMRSGIRVPDGETLTLTATNDYANNTTRCQASTIHYTLSGYYAEP